MRRALALAAVWLGLAAAGPRPFLPPPPDLAPLVPFVAAPLDKPPVVADVALPPTPAELPPLPPAALVLPGAEKPIAFVHAPRTLPCIGTWIGVASESLECGRARFQRGEYEEAARALESAARPGGDVHVLREARYWLGETYYRLGRIEQADWLFRQVAQDSPRLDWNVWALHSSGWTALRVGDVTRAREAFAGVLKGGAPTPIEAWARHGVGLAAYALGRHEEAEQAWALMLQRGTPAALGRDVVFWHGEALGRVGQADRAVATLKRFIEGGAHALVPAGHLRLAWWTLAAGRGSEALAAFRAYLAQPPSAISREWGEAGLALAQITTGDWAGARATAASLNAQRSPLALPLLLRILRASADSAPAADAEPVLQELLAGSLTSPVRGWVLLVKGEIDRAAGNRDEARTQFDLARQVAGNTPVGWQGAFRLARTNFELREFQQTVADLRPLAGAPLPPDLRMVTLILQGEAAYHAGDHAASGAAFRRALTEFPQAPESPMIRLAVAWTSLRQGSADVARREFLDFARTSPDHPHAVDALVLAAELAVAAGDLEGARALLDRIVQTYPTHPRTDFARLNRGILLARTGHPAARTVLVDWLGRAPFPALFGRAHAGLAVALLAAGDVTSAERALALAWREGLGAFASLGTGVIALRQSRLDDAASAFTDARDAGTPDVVAAAEYGLAVAGFHKGAVREFAGPAQAALAALPPGPRGADRAGELLYALTGIALEAKDWPAALASARRIVTEYQAHDAADDALERVAAGAAAAGVWAVAYEADLLLRQRFPQSPFVAAGRARVGEALLETGRVEEARRELEQASLGAATTSTRTTMLLARVREAAGDRTGALEAYARAARDGAGPEWSTPALFAHARLLLHERRWNQARGVLGRLLKTDDVAVAIEAAEAIGDTYAGEGDALAAAEYYLTAAYAAPTSPAGRRGLLGAARAFASLKQKEAAETAYRKLLAQADLPDDLAAEARQGLSSFGR